MPRRFFARHRHLKSLILLFILHIPMESPSASASKADVHNMIEICVELHRIQKDYSLVGMGIRYDKPKVDLQRAIERVNTDFRSLTADHHLGAKLESQIQPLLDEWQEVQAIATSTPSQAKMLELHKKIESLTSKCLTAVDAIEQDSQIPGEHYVALTGEMGMEVQRLAALYIMRAWQIEQDNYMAEVKHILEEFERFYGELQDADLAYVSAETKKDLQSVEKEFLVFERMVESNSGRFVPSLAQRSANKLYDHITEVSLKIIEKVEK